MITIEALSLLNQDILEFLAPQTNNEVQVWVCLSCMYNSECVCVLQKTDKLNLLHPVLIFKNDWSCMFYHFSSLKEQKK